MIKHVKLLLFDIGGVFIQLSGVEQMLAWTQGLHSEEELWNLWLHSHAVKAFETGRIAPHDFARTFIQEFSLPVDTPTFLTAFASWTTLPYPGFHEVMTAINGTYLTASLSNTNELHWHHLCSQVKIDRLFHHNFPSHKLGLMKPDTASFSHVLDTLGVSADETLFFDDTPVNITAARSLGIHAHQVCGVDHLQQTLKELDIL
ncbi:HAD family phosphatase [Desulfoluna sp.]|uniref:HAD family hydrolase n=1 Tax=Desulfoluna sp. TaxID=2045199 RepID=UPI0026270ADE|nr:HAD family phosphatase [Desulfoluna sp.]